MTTAMMRRNLNATTLLIALTLCLALVPPRLTARQRGSQDQSPQQSPPAQQTMPQSAVKLSFIVTDESGHSVADVRREDISIVEDGTPQTISDFTREESPASYGLVIDNTGSLRGVLDLMIMTGGSLISRNKPDDEAFLVRFVDSDVIQLVQDFTENPAALMKGLDSLRIEGGQTAIIDAVYLSANKLAVERAGVANRRRAIILLTDGEERASYYRQNTLLELLRRENIPIFAIGFGNQWFIQTGKIYDVPSGKRAQLLNSLAEESGGRTFFPNDIHELKSAVEEISRDLRSSYVVAYIPTNSARDGKFRKVQVTIKQLPGQPKRTVVMRSGYYEPVPISDTSHPNPHGPKLKPFEHYH
jgi:Ca-activated chloride channel family protein